MLEKFLMVCFGVMCVSGLGGILKCVINIDTVDNHVNRKWLDDGITERAFFISGALLMIGLFLETMTW